jgi:hypothetical protein
MKFTKEEIKPVLEHMRQRLNEYQLHIDSDGVYHLDGVPLSDNHLICILKKDIDRAGITNVTGSRRDFIMRRMLSDWKQRLLQEVKKKEALTPVTLKSSDQLG